MTRLTLLLVVRDAAALLPGFLDHHQDLWDELVVVDTGSGDGSADIAGRAPGAVVVHHAWQDDFAAARNAGLDRASGDWILILDADERISGADFGRLRGAIAASGSAVLLQETINYWPDMSHLEWRPLRGCYPREEAGQSGCFIARRAGCFPASPELRFTGRVHESVLPAAEAAGREVRELDVPVHHYGYVLSPVINERRRAAYRRLVERKLADAPDDATALLECATVRLEDGDVAEAEALLGSLVRHPAQRRAASRGRFLLGRLRREAGDLAAAGDLLSEACTHDPSFLFGWLEWIRVCAAQERWGEVFTLLQSARDALGTVEPLLEREALRALVKTGRLVEARKLAGDLADSCPQWSEIAGLKRRLEELAAE